jgi:vacuolar-type H+-ATPase subunit H
MNEKHIEQVLEIEKQAQELQEKARREAAEIPVKAEQEAQLLIAKAKADAQEEARKMMTDAQTGNASGDQSRGSDSENSDFEAAAKKNFDKAVTFVLERVIGGA